MLDAPWTPLLTALYLQIPVVIGGVLHMLVVTQDRWTCLKVPVHERWFGANKTWRGMLAMPMLCALGGWCLTPIEALLGPRAVLGPSPALTGAVAGLAYVLAELPNSFFKRRLGIAAGALPQRHRGLFIFLDQFDSALGVALAYGWYLGCSGEVCLDYALSFPVTALLVKRMLFMAKLKRSAV